MPTLAFWNTAGNVAPATIAAFAHESDADVLILAENNWSNNELVLALNDGVDRFYFPDLLPVGRLTIFTRFIPERSVLVDDSDYISVRHYRWPASESILVVAAHLPSKMWKTPDDQSLFMTRIASYIREVEAKVGHQRTVIIGDLNMNPFESGVVASEGLHAISDRRIAASVSRKVLGEQRDFFYNPMWSFWGDGGPFPPGTYYRSSGAVVEYYWHIFDQVLIRPTLLEFVERDAVRIATEIMGTSLLTENGKPNHHEYSDHLPVVFRLSLETEGILNG